MENKTPLINRVWTRTIFADGHTEQKKEAVLSEHVLELSVNGELLSPILCTRTELRELIVGRFYTQRLIECLDDIAEICFSDGETKAEAYLVRRMQKRPLRRLEASSAWESNRIFALVKRFREGMPLHDETFSTHSAHLMWNEEVFCSCEDISRHNAVDKAVGCALLQGVPLSECILFTSGRVPSDMAVKAIAAGIPVLVSKGAATAEAIRLAEEYGLTLLCRASKGSYVLAAAP